MTVTLCFTISAQKWREDAACQITRGCCHAATSSCCCLQKPSIAPPNMRIGDSEFWGMFHFGNSVAAWLSAVAAAATVALAVVWLEFGGASSTDYARDYEDCVERLQTLGMADEEHNSALTGCSARFAGRRKADG